MSQVYDKKLTKFYIFDFIGQQKTNKNKKREHKNQKKQVEKVDNNQNQLVQLSGQQEHAKNSPLQPQVHLHGPQRRPTVDEFIHPKSYL